MRSKHPVGIAVMLFLAMIGMYCLMIGLYSYLDGSAPVTWYEHVVTLILSYQTVSQLKTQVLRREGDL